MGLISDDMVVKTVNFFLLTHDIVNLFLETGHNFDLGVIFIEGCLVLFKLNHYVVAFQV